MATTQDRDNVETKPMRFVPDGGKRAWRPIAGHTAPPGEFYEYRSIPGNVVAIASTQQEAITKLSFHISISMQMHGNPEEWYAEAWNRTNQEDRERFGKKMTVVAERRINPTTPPVPTSTILYATVSPRKLGFSPAKDERIQMFDTAFNQSCLSY